MFHGRHGHDSLGGKSESNVFYENTLLWTTFSKLITRSKIRETQFFSAWGVEKFVLFHSGSVEVSLKVGKDAKNCLDRSHRNLTLGEFSELIAVSIQISYENFSLKCSLLTTMK